MNRLLLASALLFSSGAVAEELVLCSTNAADLPDGSVSGHTVQFEVPEASTGRVVISATLDLELEHPWVGDLVVTLGAPEAASVVMLDRVGQVPFGFPGPFGCGGDDVLATFDDAAAESAEEVCEIGPQPVLAGSLRPLQELSLLNGVDPVGTWSLVVSDRQTGDAGRFISACLRLVVLEDCDGDGVPDKCSCTGDLDGTGVVDGADMAYLLGAWNTADAVADLDLDGVVGGADLSMLLGNWGSCN